jgi:hypothetical protein
MIRLIWFSCFLLLAGIGCSSLGSPTRGGGPNNPDAVSYSRPLFSNASLRPLP